jgi:hypothetical protein
LNFDEVHGIISQRRELFITTAVGSTLPESSSIYAGETEVVYETNLGTET